MGANKRTEDMTANELTDAIFGEGAAEMFRGQARPPAKIEAEVAGIVGWHAWQARDGSLGLSDQIRALADGLDDWRPPQYPGEDRIPGPRKTRLYCLASEASCHED